MSVKLLLRADRHRTLAALALALAGSLAAGARAQTEAPTGSIMSMPSAAEIPDTRHMTPAEKGRVTIMSFARCMVQRHRVAMEKALAIPPLDDASSIAFKRLVSGGECLSYGELKMNQSLLRGGLFSALYRADFSRAPGAAAASTVDWSRDVGGSTTPEQMQYVGLRQFADCAVRADPADARTAVLSAPVSVQERDAYVRLAPQLNACAVKGQSLTFSKTVLSGLLAEVLYRNAKGY